MPQKRNSENKGYPPRWRVLHGAIYYRVPKGLEYQWNNKQLFRLGKTASEAYKVWAERAEGQVKSDTIGQLLDRYMREVIPTKEPSTQRSNTGELKQLRATFSDTHLCDLEPKDIYKYVDTRSAKVSAKREIALLSHAFTKAVEWGYISQHPFKGEVRLAGEKPRTRYVEDWEILECLSLPPMRKAGSVRAIQAYIRIKLLTGMRRGDLLRLRCADITDEGIKVCTNKTGKHVTYEWSDSLRTAVEMAKSARPVDISAYLFCNDSGQGYMDESTGQADGWASMWQRFFKRVIKETKVTENFTEHDLRAKVASDAESLEHARQLLTHADSKITQRVYRRKSEIIKPAK